MGHPLGTSTDGEISCHVQGDTQEVVAGRERMGLVIKKYPKKGIYVSC